MRLFRRRTSGPPSDAVRPADAVRLPRRRSRRLLRVAGIAVLVALGLALLSTAANLILEAKEKSSISPYGERIAISGGGAMNVYRNGHPGQPIVLLSGLGTPAPALDFAPLIRELGGFEVIVVEGFGYGYSDMEASERTNRNISTELHEVLGKLDVKKPYVLAGHSIAGFYMLDYANRYPTEVGGVVGIDATIPKPGEGPVEDPRPEVNWQRALAVTGVVRTVVSIAPSLALPDGNAYTADELERIRLMTSWNFGNPAVADETARIANNAAALRGVRYPDALPVLAFVADENPEDTARKTASAQALLNNVRRLQIVPLKGGHYLHWTQAKRMAEVITAFVGQKGS